MGQIDQQADIAGDIQRQAASKYPFLNGQDVTLVDKTSTTSPWHSETWDVGNVKGRPQEYDLNKNYVERFDKNFSPDDYAAEVLSHIDPQGKAYAQKLLSAMNEDQIRELKQAAGDYKSTIDNGQPESEALRNASQAMLRGYVFGQWPKESFNELDPKLKAILEDAKNYALHGNRKPIGPKTKQLRDLRNQYAPK